MLSVTRDEALASLTDVDGHARLQAARALARVGTVGDLELLKDARHRETVAYVQRALDAAILRLLLEPKADPGEVPHDVGDISQTDLARVRAEAMEEAAGMLLHEIASPLGLVKLAALKEVDNYLNSETKKRLDAVQQVFDAIVQLKSVAVAPKRTEFDLYQLVSDVLDSELGPGRERVSLIGARPHMVSGDSLLLERAVCNGLRNALEATSTVENDPHTVIVNWGSTNKENWIAVIDRGSGFLGAIEGAFRIGETTKVGHSGFGLAIARQAIESMGGEVSLHSKIGDGTRFEVRWPK